jgi:hypothetical protein
MWLLLQSAVIFAVMASNIHWQWTPNPYVAGLYAIGAAVGTTDFVNWVANRFRRG